MLIFKTHETDQTKVVADPNPECAWVFSEDVVSTPEVSKHEMTFYGLLNAMIRLKVKSIVFTRATGEQAEINVENYPADKLIVIKPSGCKTCR